MTTIDRRSVARSYKLVVLSSIATFIAAFVPLKYSILAIPVACYATWVMSRAIKASAIFTTVYLFLAFVPVINILALISLNARASRLLKAQGLEVGLFGVRTNDLR